MLTVEEDTYTPAEAAKVLRLTKRRVTQMLNSGELEGWQDQNARWRIPQWAVHEQLEERRDSEVAFTRPQVASTEAVELRRRIEDLQRELGRLEGEINARRQLSEVAESTLREQLERERQRADDERERVERLEEELREARKEAGRSWWRRLFHR